jgi:hypothetical protein
MNPRKHSLRKAILSNIHFLGQCTLMSREQVMSNQQVTGTPYNLIPALRVCYYQTVMSCVQGETRNSWESMHHSEMKRGLFCLVSSRPNLHKGLWTFKPWVMVVCCSSVLGIPQSWRAQVNDILFHPCLNFLPATLNWESFHTKQGHLPPTSSIDCLGCHSNKPGRSCLWTFPITGDVGPLWHQNQIVSDWPDSISIPAKAPFPAHSRHFCASNRQGLLIWGWLISSSYPPHLFKVQLRWHSSPVPQIYLSGSYILEYKKCFYWWVQKHLKPFAVQSARKSPITLNEEISLPDLHLP